MIQVLAQRDATLSLFKMDLPGKLREDGDLCDWKKWLGGQIMIRCEQQEFMTKIHRDRDLYHVFFEAITFAPSHGFT